MSRASSVTERTPLIPGSRSSNPHTPRSTPNFPRLFKEENDQESISDVQLVLLNNGSVARDHLASERTFMAYVRTSLALGGTGIALAQLFAIGRVPARVQIGKQLGAASIATALLVLAIGTTRFFQVQKTLTTGSFPVATFGIVLITLSVGGLVLVALSNLTTGLAAFP